MTTTKKPRVVYSWVVRRLSARGAKTSGEPRVKVECIWSLVGANGEHMCSSFPEGYRNRGDAKRAVNAVALALCGLPVDMAADGSGVAMNVRQVGPGPRPKADLEA